MLPLRTIATRLHSSSTSARRWLESSTVIPSSASRRISNAHVAHAAGVQAGRRLVEHQQLGPAQQRRGDAQSLAHPVRVAADLVAGAVGQLDDVKHLGDARRRAVTVERCEQPQVRAAVEVRVEARRLDEAGDALERATPRAAGRGRTRAPCRRSGGSARASSATTSSSPRRSGRGTRRRRRARPSGPRRRPP